MANSAWSFGFLFAFTLELNHINHFSSFILSFFFSGRLVSRPLKGAHISCPLLNTLSSHAKSNLNFFLTMSSSSSPNFFSFSLPSQVVNYHSSIRHHRRHGCLLHGFVRHLSLAVKKHTLHLEGSDDELQQDQREFPLDAPCLVQQRQYFFIDQTYAPPLTTHKAIKFTKFENSNFCSPQKLCDDSFY